MPSHEKVQIAWNVRIPYLPLARSLITLVRQDLLAALTSGGQLENSVSAPKIPGLPDINNEGLHAQNDPVR